MSLLALLMGGIISWWLMVYWNQPLDMGLVAQEPTPVIQHVWYSLDNERQAMVHKAYELGWLDFVLMIECESWFNPKARWDSWRAYGLCQMNTRWHDLPQQYYNDREYQIEYCYNKWINWTKFYGPNRKIKGQLCKDYVLDRFIIKW